MVGAVMWNEPFSLDGDILRADYDDVRGHYGARVLEEGRRIEQSLPPDLNGVVGLMCFHQLD